MSNSRLWGTISVAAPWLPAAVCCAAWANGDAPAWILPAGAVAAAIASVTSAREIAMHHAERRAAARRISDADGRAAQLAAQLSNYRDAFDSAVTGMLVSDTQGVILLCNPAAARFFSREPDAVLGRHIEDIYTRAEMRSIHAAALAGKPGDIQLRAMLPGGQRIFLVLAQPISPGVLVTLRDITELALASQLKTDFVANASHELRTPLASVRAATETLADGAWDDPAMRDRLARLALDNVARLEAMIADLLDLSRLESPDSTVNLEETDLLQVASRLREAFAPALAERSLSIKLEVDPAVAVIRTDPSLLELILRNLLENATKFAYDNTAIRLVAQPCKTGVQIQVVDRGIGIPIGHQQRIFERFYQVDPARTGSPLKRGTGLGLAIVKHAVRSLGGTISVNSVWKQGTTMTVDIPACLTQPAAA